MAVCERAVEFGVCYQSGNEEETLARVSLKYMPL